MEPDTTCSSTRRHNDERSRREERQHKSGHRSSRSPTRRSESKRRSKRSKKSTRRSYSPSSSSSSSSSSTSSCYQKRRKSSKRKHTKKRKHQHRDSRPSPEPKENNDATTQITTMHNKSEINSGDKNPSTAIETPKQSEAQAKGPMTQAQYLQLQSQIREVVDPATGRVRLVRGTGEIVERIVSKIEHQHLNALATRRDGDGYTKEVARQAMHRRMGR